MHLVGFLQPRITMHGTTNIEKHPSMSYTNSAKKLYA